MEQQPRRIACSPGPAHLLDGRLVVDLVLSAVEVDLRAHLSAALLQQTPLRSSSSSSSSSTGEALLESVLRLRVVVVLWSAVWYRGRRDCVMEGDRGRRVREGGRGRE